jgi:uncharacterized protein with NRDE domain
MCLIFISINNHPTYKLIIAANRDEFYNRKTAAADFWEDKPSILGGRDLEACGTWMAMTKTGRIGMITNYRDPQNINPKAPSRGELVSDYLESDIHGLSYLNAIETKAKDYNGFNLIVGTQDELWYLSNYKKGIEKLKAGLFGLSNHLLETPWPKIIRGKEKLAPLLKEKTIDIKNVFEVLYDSQQAIDESLPNTGIGLERERMLSSMFIKSPNYGSRCSTVVLIDHQNQVQLTERVYDLATFDYTTRDFNFQLGKNSLE